MVRNQIEDAGEEFEKMAGSEGKYGLGLLGAGLAVIARDRPKLAGGLALVIGGIGLVAYGLLNQFMKSMGMA
jgi:hypothetical protein